MSSYWPEACKEIIQQKISEVYPYLDAVVEEESEGGRLKVHVVVPGKLDEDIYLEELKRDYLLLYVLDEITGELKEEGENHLVKILKSFNSRLKEALRKKSK